MEQQWYSIENEQGLDSPSLLIYRKRVQRNIDLMIKMAGNPDRLMVHVKTNKMPGIVKMLLTSGISRFKCSTIAEAEMVCRAGGEYLVLAHQLVGPKVGRLIRLRQQYPNVFMASLLDNRHSAEEHQQLFAEAGLVAEVLLDVNNGMNRSGHPLNEEILPLYQYLHQQPNLRCHGLHVYDGHWRDSDFSTRKSNIDAGFAGVEKLTEAISNSGLPKPMVVAGGTPAFTSHLLRDDAYCSPGTCVLWDWGYGEKLQEQAFEFAALVFTRIISKPERGIITIDLGHKAIAAENPIDKRVRFLNLKDYELLSQSEEHGVLKVGNWDALRVGDVLYGVPYHVCPTVNLYQEASIIEKGRAVDSWEVLGGKRKISV
ncbi:D-TA family PLP-dependent enzyme [Cesiribacter sp. SM1]|uniref:D-TA family PLP-dependent enzyme n=1 Tax=Cesiribacter sp. SM1 TaxID=2861196 RepID=UPI001CD480A8|nr:D-TA family PLP-dependent enzyme [Cesiribacter sp. SM1]